MIFTYKQMKASQDSLKLAIKQFKVDKQPCIVYKTIKSEGTHCFYKQRRQLHINLKIENIEMLRLCLFMCFHICNFKIVI